jgi:hypothetical protein
MTDVLGTGGGRTSIFEPCTCLHFILADDSFCVSGEARLQMWRLRASSLGLVLGQPVNSPLWTSDRNRTDRTLRHDDDWGLWGEGLLIVLVHVTRQRVHYLS